jgi:hypothetical protein
MIPLVVVFLLFCPDSSDCFATSRYTVWHDSTNSVLPQCQHPSAPSPTPSFKSFAMTPGRSSNLLHPWLLVLWPCQSCWHLPASLFLAPQLGGAIATGLTSLLASPLIEAEVLNDMAHLTLDLASFFGPAGLAIRAAAVLGRMAVMGADCCLIIPCYRKSWSFSFFMLGLAWMALSEMPVVVCRSWPVTLLSRWQSLFSLWTCRYDLASSVQSLVRSSLDWVRSNQVRPLFERALFLNDVDTFTGLRW